MWPQPGALGSVVDYRVSYGTDDWNDDADKFSLGTAIEDVSSRLEMQRQVDQISAVQCRQRSAAKSATSKEATARLCARRSQQPRLQGHDDCPHAGPRVTAGGAHLEDQGPGDFNVYGSFYVRLYWAGFGFQVNLVEEHVLCSAFLHDSVGLERTWAQKLFPGLMSGQLNLAITGLMLLTTEKSFVLDTVGQRKQCEVCHGCESY